MKIWMMMMVRWLKAKNPRKSKRLTKTTRRYPDLAQEIKEKRFKY